MTLLRFKKFQVLREGHLLKQVLNVAFILNVLKDLPTYGFSPFTKHPGYVYILSSFDFV